MTPPPAGPDASSPDGSTTCGKCGQLHMRGCMAHRKSDGGPCTQPAMRGQRVCRLHGGGAPQNRRAAARREAEAEVRQEAERLGLRREVSSEEALTELLHRSASLVAHYGSLIAATETDNDLTQLTTAGYQPSVFVKLYGEERDRMASVASWCVKLGLEERQVRIAERQGELLVGVLREVTGWLLTRWREGAELTAVEAELPGVVRRELLAMSSIETMGVGV